MLFQQQGGLKQATGEGPGLDFNPKFFISLLKAVIAGNVLNTVSYRIRPYEVNPGETNNVLEECKLILQAAFEKRSSVIHALYKCRKLLNAIPVDRLQPKPKVSIIGEFWAMTTEGDGNYKLQQFLESEGAEVDI
jgi:predicted nucleotide-binding protein (sugar kinase/HSP70/actin superfamily)